MNCSKYKDKLHSYIKNNLKESERLELTAHLKSCFDCNRKIAEIKKAEDFFRASKITLSPMIMPPPDLKLNIMAAIDLNKYKVPKKKNLFDLSNWGLSMVAAGLILFILNMAPGVNQFDTAGNQLYNGSDSLGKKMAVSMHSLGQSASGIEKLDGITMRIENAIKGGM